MSDQYQTPYKVVVGYLGEMSNGVFAERLATEAPPDSYRIVGFTTLDNAVVALAEPKD
jgi:hypothetical protein